MGMFKNIKLKIAGCLHLDTDGLTEISIYISIYIEREIDE